MSIKVLTYLLTNGITIRSAVFAQMTAGCPYTLQWTALRPQNCPFPLGDLDCHLTHASSDPPESSCISIGSAVFARITTVKGQF